MAYASALGRRSRLEAERARLLPPRRPRARLERSDSVARRRTRARPRAHSAPTALRPPAPARFSRGAVAEQKSIRVAAHEPRPGSFGTYPNDGTLIVN